MNTTKLLFALFAFSGTVFAQSSRTEQNEDREYSNVIRSIPAPNSSTDDIAFDGENLWVGTANGSIFKVSPIDGKILKEIPVNSSYAYGMAFDGEHIWLSERDKFKIVKMDLEGNVLKEIEVNHSLNLNGLAWHNGELWLNNNEEGSAIGDTTFVLSPESGEVLRYFLPHGEQPTGLASDGKYIWTSDNLKDEIYKLDPITFEVLQTIPAPGGDYPNGLAFDGKYLWVGNNSTDRLYQIDIEHPDLNNESEEVELIIEEPTIVSGIIEADLVEPIPVREEILESTLELVENVNPELRIYPNPTADVLHIKCNLDTPLAIEVYDSKGLLVVKAENVDRINTSRLIPGAYLIKVSSFEYTFSERFIKH